METLTNLPVECGFATRSLPGEPDSGDRQVVKVLHGRVVAAVMDGLGHGKDAAHAATRALELIEAYANESPASLMKRCHEQLVGTRGVAMSIAVVNWSERNIAWLGVGNVEGIILRPKASDRWNREQLLLRGGVVGGRLPQLTPVVSQINPGDILILATDGVAADFADEVRPSPSQSAHELAEDLLNRYWKGSDDALVLVMRFGARRHDPDPKGAGRGLS